jgi:hypothetical protein
MWQLHGAAAGRDTGGLAMRRNAAFGASFVLRRFPETNDCTAASRAAFPEQQSSLLTSSAVGYTGAYNVERYIAKSRRVWHIVVPIVNWQVADDLQGVAKSRKKHSYRLHYA